MFVYFEMMFPKSMSVLYGVTNYGRGRHAELVRCETHAQRAVDGWTVDGQSKQEHGTADSHKSTWEY